MDTYTPTSFYDMTHIDLNVEVGFCCNQDLNNSILTFLTGSMQNSESIVYKQIEGE